MWVIALALLGCKGEPVEEPSPVNLVGVPGIVTVQVTDQEGLPIGDARVEMTQWPRSYGYGEASVSHDVPPLVFTTDSSGSITMDPFSSGAYAAKEALPEGMTRVEVTADGYDKMIFYKKLQYAETCATDFGGEAGALVSCASWNLDLVAHDDDDATLLPDVIIDAATISDCRLEGEGEERQLRISIGTPNVGRGAVDLRSDQESTVVRQRLYRRDGTTFEEVLEDAAFVWDGHEDHDHFHFENWTHMKLLDTNEQEVARSNKVSFCLIDLGMYDTEIYEDVWGRPTQFTCGVSWGEGEIQQGLSPGMLDIYDRTLTGQFIEIGELEAGTYLLEVVADPEGHIDELDRTNNVARVVVTLPDEPVSWNYNPCQPPHLQPMGDGGSGGGADETLDLTGRTEAVLTEACEDAPLLGTGSYWGKLSGFADDNPIGAGEDGWFRVEVSDGQTLQLAANLEGDVMIGMRAGCDGQVLGIQDGPGWLQWETTAWQNDTGAPVTVGVLLDNYNEDGTAGNAIFDVVVQ